jgi:ssRNA-specific RNase YbeY (16S rRNA maturation enzyme)
LSFSQAEGEPIKVPSDRLRLGDIVLSYPQVINDAVRDEMLVDDKVDQLVEHGLMHLLGIHHE